MLLEPQTFMNESGRSVGEALRFWKLDASALVVIHDELDLAPGKVRVKVGGGNAGHNGLRSISAHVGNDYKRVRIGIGHPGDKALVYYYVLSDFAKSEAGWVEAVCEAIARRRALACRGPGRELSEQDPSGDRGCGIRREVQRLKSSLSRRRATSTGGSDGRIDDKGRGAFRSAAIAMGGDRAPGSRKPSTSLATAGRSNRRRLFGFVAETRRGWGAVLIAEIDGAFAGFVAGWIEEETHICETPHSNRFGYVSDICVLPDYRGRRVAAGFSTPWSGAFATRASPACGFTPLPRTARREQATNVRAMRPYEVVYEKSL